VAILSSTRVEWLLADFGVMNAGAATTTVYPTTEPEEAQFIIGDSESVILIAENAAQAAKVAGANLPHLRQIIVIDGEAPAGDVPVTTLAELEASGGAALAEDPTWSPYGGRDRARAPGHAHLHLRHDGPPEGRRAAARRLGLAGRRQRENGMVTRTTSSTVAAAVALVRQDARVQPRARRLATYVDGRVDKIIVNWAGCVPR